MKTLDTSDQKTKADGKTPKKGKQGATKRSIIEREFAKNYIQLDGNGTRAYLEVKPNVSVKAAAVQATRLLKRDSARRRIVEAMERYGVNEEKLSEKIGQMLAYDPEDHFSLTAVDKGIKHARAILGVDAEKKSHIKVDRRSININVSSAADSLAKMIDKTSK